MVDINVDLTRDVNLFFISSSLILHLLNVLNSNLMPIDHSFAFYNDFNYLMISYVLFHVYNSCCIYS